MIDADRIREASEQVLDGPGYRGLRDGILERWLAEARSWFAELLFDMFQGPAAANVGIVVAVVVVLAVVVLGVIALGGVRRRAAADLVVDDPAGRTHEDAMAMATAARAAGDVVGAVRARYGALLLLLVERDVVPELPGITVGEVNVAVVRSAPSCADAVVAAGEALADIVYGHRPATPGDDDIVAEAVRRVAREVSRQAVAR